MNGKRKYKICHVLYQEFPLDPRVRRYVRAVNEEGLYSIVICSKGKERKYFENWEQNLIYRIPISKRRKSFILTFIEYNAFTLLSGVLLVYLGLKYRFKGIQVHSLPDSLIFSAALNKLFGAKLILDMHEILPEFFISLRPNSENSVWIKIIKIIEKISCNFADAVITIHDPAKEVLSKRNKNIASKIQVIMNGVDENEFKESKHILSGEFTIMFNGTVVKLLNLDIILRALNDLKGKIPEEDYKRIKFRILGDGPALNDLHHLAKELGLNDKFVSHGFIQQSDMLKEVLKSSVCIIPPLKNIYSDLFYTTKLVEMAYLKIPVIATRLKTYRYYYDEDSLFYFESGNREQLVERIKEVFYDKELVARKVENAKAAYQKVSWNGVMKKRYIDYIQKLGLR